MSLIRTLSRLLLVSAALMASAHAATLDEARAKGLKWLVQNQGGDGAWRSDDGVLGVQATASAIEALQRGGMARSPQFGSALSWIANADADSNDALAHKARGLTSGGLTSAAQIAADKLYGQRGASSEAVWGGYPGHQIDFIDTALGLEALRVSDAGYETKAAQSGSGLLSGVCRILTNALTPTSGQTAWSLLPAATGAAPAGGRPSVLASAHLLAELRSIQSRLGWDGFTCGGTNYTLTNVIANAQTWLAAQQNADGGYGEIRSNGTKGPSGVIVSSVAYRALAGAASPIQPATNNLSAYLIGQQDATNGSWRADALVTAQVLSVLPEATGAQLVDSDLDGLPDAVETQLGSSTTTADANAQMQSPDLSRLGETATGFSATGELHVPFSHDLGVADSFAISSGTLPPGVELNAATGVLSGTPTQIGQYSFEFTMVNAAAPLRLIGRIDVLDGGTDGDVPLPAWALALLAGAMLHAVKRNSAT